MITKTDFLNLCSFLWKHQVIWILREDGGKYLMRFSPHWLFNQRGIHCVSVVEAKSEFRAFTTVSILQKLLDFFNPYGALAKISSLRIQAFGFIVIQFSCYGAPDRWKSCSGIRLDALSDKPQMKPLKRRMLNFALNKSIEQVFLLLLLLIWQQKCSEDNDTMLLEHVAKAHNLEIARPRASGSNIESKRRDTECPVLAPSSCNSLQKTLCLAHTGLINLDWP